MRRVLLITAGLTALSCAHRTGAPEEGAPTQGAAELSVIPEFQPQPGETTTSYDVDRNGKPDLWRSTRVEAEGKELLLRKAKDLDGDGRIDCWEAYGPDGTLSKLVYDLDFDGAPDAILTFEKDQLVKKEYAFGFDGQSRSWSYFEKGKLVRKERDTSGDGRVDTWEYWEGGELDRIGVDLDGDGQVDRWETRKAPEGTAAAQPTDESDAEPAQK
jgi:hypothetical protein